MVENVGIMLTVSSSKPRPLYSSLLGLRVYFGYCICLIIKEMMFTSCEWRKQHIKVSDCELHSSLEDQHLTKSTLTLIPGCSLEVEISSLVMRALLIQTANWLGNMWGRWNWEEKHTHGCWGAFEGNFEWRRDREGTGGFKFSSFSCISLTSKPFTFSLWG